MWDVACYAKNEVADTGVLWDEEEAGAPESGFLALRVEDGDLAGVFAGA